LVNGCMHPAPPAPRPSAVFVLFAVALSLVLAAPGATRGVTVGSVGPVMGSTAGSPVGNGQALASGAIPEPEMTEAPAPHPGLESRVDWGRPDPPSLGVVARSMLRAERPVTRAWVGHVLGSILRGEAREELSGLLSDEDSLVRLTAACAIQPVDLESTAWLEGVLPVVLDLGPEDAIWFLATTVRDRVSHDGKRALLDLAEIYLAEHPLHPMGVRFVDQLLA